MSFSFPQDPIMGALYVLLALLLLGVLVLMTIPMVLLFQFLLGKYARGESHDSLQHRLRDAGRFLNSSDSFGKLLQIKRYFWYVWAVFMILLIGLVIYRVIMR